jgi:hypothetical protein
VIGGQFFLYDVFRAAEHVSPQDLTQVVIRKSSDFIIEMPVEERKDDEVYIQMSIFSKDHRFRIDA